jgi:hypothetical protein
MQVLIVPGRFGKGEDQNAACQFAYQAVIRELQSAV